MLFLVHDDEGRIEQSNKVYSHEGYDKVLDDHGRKFISIDTPNVLDPQAYYIATGSLRVREPMAIGVSAGSWKAGKQGITLSCLPKPCQMTVLAGGVAFHSETVVDGQAYIESDIPGVYTVTLDAWPYLPWSTDLECAA